METEKTVNILAMFMNPISERTTFPMFMNPKCSSEGAKIDCMDKETDSTASQKANVENVIPQSDLVDVGFDWLPTAQDNRVTFQVRIARGGKESIVDFEVDLRQLCEVDLERLEQILVRRHGSMDSGYEVTRAIVWLLDVSLTQNEPLLSKAERDMKVQELLLSNRANLSARK